MYKAILTLLFFASPVFAQGNFDFDKFYLGKIFEECDRLGVPVKVEQSDKAKKCWYAKCKGKGDNWKTQSEEKLKCFSTAEFETWVEKKILEDSIEITTDDNTEFDIKKCKKQGDCTERIDGKGGIYVRSNCYRRNGKLRKGCRQVTEVCPHGHSNCVSTQDEIRVIAENDCPNGNCGKNRDKGGNRSPFNVWWALGTLGMAAGQTWQGIEQAKAAKEFAKACPTAYAAYASEYGASIQHYNEQVNYFNENIAPPNELVERQFKTPTFKTPNCNGGSFGQYAGLAGGMFGGSMGGMNYNPLFPQNYYGGGMGLNGVNPYGMMGISGGFNINGGLTGYPGGWMNGGMYQPGGPNWWAGTQGQIGYPAVPGNCACFQAAGCPCYNQGGVSGGLVAGGYIAGGMAGGYTGGYPAGGYPAGGYPAGGYPAGGYPAGGYVAGGYPAGGYNQMGMYEAMNRQQMGRQFNAQYFGQRAMGNYGYMQYQQPGQYFPPF